MMDNKIIEKDIVVTMDYNLEVDGQEIDSGPIQFIFGHGNIIPGLENEIAGMTIGDEKKVHVKAKDAYGEYDPELEIEVPLTTFPEDFEIKLGQPMRMQDGEGHIFTAVAMALTSDTVKLNMNHPLAGKDLLFKTSVKNLRAATETEIQQGRLASVCSSCSTGDCEGCN